MTPGAFFGIVSSIMVRKLEEWNLRRPSAAKPFGCRPRSLRYHESLKNLTPADVCFGSGQTILLKRERIKRDTIKNRRLQHQKKVA